MAESKMNKEPLPFEQRLILQNLFDTQPEKRKAYLKQLGYEMNPKNENEYRPLGSDYAWSEIDPGISKYLHPGGAVEFGKELFGDLVGDVAFDALSSVISGAGARLGLAKGTAVGGAAGGAGAPVGAVIGAVLGGAAGNALAETVKQTVGNMVLDESIPADKKLVAIQSLFAGAMPEVIKLGRHASAATYKSILESRTKAIARAASSAGTGVTPEILDKAAQNPEMFTEDAVKGASGKLSELYRNIFGTTVDNPTSTRQITGGIFADKLKPLNQAATNEIEALAKDPRANWKIDELAAPIKKVVAQLNDKFDRTAEEDAALKYLKGKLSMLESKLGDKVEKSTLLDASGNAIETVTPGRGQINFKEGREFLKAIQDDAFNREVPGSSFLKQVAGGSEEALRGIADAKAGALGSKLPEINAERSKILTTYKNAQQLLTPSSITSAFIGSDNVKKNMIREAVGEMDKNLGTNYSQAIENGAMQRVVEEMYRDPNKAFGSGMVKTEALKGALKGGTGGFLAGSAVGFPTGTAAITVPVATGLGAIGGASAATALSSPKAAMGAIQKNASRIDDLANLLANPVSTPMGAVGTYIGNVTGKKIGPAAVNAVMPKEASAAESNPFLEGLDLTEEDKKNPFLEGL